MKEKDNLFDKIIGRSLEEKIAIKEHLEDVKRKGYNYKRNGRWAFTLVFGFNEFVSSMFSILCFIINIFLFKKYKKRILIKQKDIKQLIQFNYYISNLAYLSAFLFHCQETVFTRNADYCTAVLSILSFVLLKVIKLLIILKYKRVKWIYLVVIIILLLYFSYMYIIKFDYRLNRIFCGTLVVIGTVASIIIIFSCKELLKNSISYWICLYLGFLIESMDFPPLFNYTTDSHSLWHMMLLLSIPCYYKMLETEFLLIKF
ncbi:PGAP3 [Hepatospora eriocheir]|uniref:Post-GPI attachment to proteins factor 3 n=1 Tax=Hepatospora eriocheir TaxID=1081669 RepID=A0A1X0QLK5_9MICR|nr:PGAP3 [Hepatospora eriocheir]